MFDIGWQEIIILMLIALIVVGPKDLPRIVKTAGQWMGKARGYARDFQRTIEEAADATEIDAIKKEINEANKELTTASRDVADGTDSMNKMFSEDAMKSSKTEAAKPNGGKAPADEATGADGGTAEPATESEPAAAEATPATPATPTAEAQGNGADGSPARGASA